MNENQSLAIPTNDLTITQVGTIFSQSGFFQDSKGEAQAITKILAGAENGFGPFTSMTGIHIIKGKLEIGADLIATAIKRHPLYDFRVRALTNEECKIEFFERSEFTGGKWESAGISTFTLQDAKNAGLAGDMYKKYARNMLYARAMSNGQAWFCPDVFQSRVYTEGEISGYTPYDNEYDQPVQNNESLPNVPEVLQKARDSIDELLDQYNINVFERTKSFEKHFGCQLIDCNDIKKMRSYYSYKRNQMLDKTRVMLIAKRPKEVEQFDKARKNSRFAYCLEMFYDVTNNQASPSIDEIEAMRMTLKDIAPEQFDEFNELISLEKYEEAKKLVDAASFGIVE